MEYNDFTQPPIVNVFAEIKINATYIAVIKFIHWYNENK